MKAQTRQYRLASGVDLREVAACLPSNVTGADIGAVSSAAFGAAMQRKLKQLRGAAAAIMAVDASGGAGGGACSILRSNEGEGGDDTVESDDDHDEDDEEEEDDYDEFDDDFSWDLRSFVNKLSSEELQVTVEMADFMSAARKLKPSVVDLAYYESLGEVYDDTRLSTAGDISNAM